MHLHIEHNVSRKKNGPKNPWISSAIIKSIRKKHTLYKKYKSSNFNEEYGNKYKKYRNTLVTVIKKMLRDCIIAILLIITKMICERPGNH